MGFLVLLAGSGFVVFRPQWMQKHVFPKFLVAVLDILFPLYFVFRIPRGWNEAVTLGWPFLLGMFVLGLVSVGVQAWLAYRAVRFRPQWVSYPTAFILLAAMHNAGFVPLPILSRLAPGPIIIGMAFYFLAFNIIIWTVALSVIQTGRFRLWPFRVKVTPALVGLVLGFLLSVTGGYKFIPENVMVAGSWLGDLGLDLALVAMGGALAGIREKLVFEREHWYFTGWLMVLYPAVVLGITMLPLPIFAGSLGWAIRLVLVLEAAMPPASLVLVVTHAYGKPDQVHYTGSMILFTYLVSLVTVPLFVGLTVFLHA
jgi:predicted permease